MSSVLRFEEASSTAHMKCFRHCFALVMGTCHLCLFVVSADHKEVWVGGAVGGARVSQSRCREFEPLLTHSIDPLAGLEVTHLATPAILWEILIAKGWFRGVMVSTGDFESPDPSSILGGTYHLNYH